MSIKVITKVWDYPHLRDQSQLLVMLALADYSTDDGESFPRVETLAEKARISERHVQKILAHLQEHGLLTIEKGAGKGRKPWMRTNLYRINIEKLTAGDPIPKPFYKQSPKKERHDDTPLTGGIMPPLPVAYETSPAGTDTGGMMPPKPSVREPSKKETKKNVPSLPAIDGHSSSFSSGSQEGNESIHRPTSMACLEDSPEEIADKLLSEFGPFSASQRQWIADEIERCPEYVLEKAAATRQKPRENNAQAFLAAVRDDWKPSKASVVKKASVSTKPAPSYGTAADLDDNQKELGLSALSVIKANVSSGS